MSDMSTVTVSTTGAGEPTAVGTPVYGTPVCTTGTGIKIGTLIGGNDSGCTGISPPEWIDDTTTDPLGETPWGGPYPITIEPLPAAPIDWKGPPLQEIIDQMRFPPKKTRMARLILKKKKPAEKKPDEKPAEKSAMSEREALLSMPLLDVLRAHGLLVKEVTATHVPGDFPRITLELIATDAAAASKALDSLGVMSVPGSKGEFDDRF